MYAHTIESVHSNVPKQEERQRKERWHRNKGAKSDNDQPTHSTCIGVCVLCARKKKKNSTIIDVLVVYFFLSLPIRFSYNSFAPFA